MLTAVASLASVAPAALTRGATASAASAASAPSVLFLADGVTVGASGLYTAGTTAGSYRVIAVLQGTAFADTARVTIVAPPPAVVTPMQVVRLDAGSGATLVSSGIPLPPGRLTTGQLGQVRVFVNGVEQAIYVEALEGRHPDGSVRSVLVQFNANLTAGLPVSAEFRTGEVRGTTDIAKTAIAWDAQPAGVLLPTSPDYIVSTDVLLMPTLTRAQTPAVGVLPQWDQDLLSYGYGHAKCLFSYGNPSECGEAATPGINYYDHAYSNFVAWARGVSGATQAVGAVPAGVVRTPTDFFLRGVRVARAYTRDFLAPNAARVQPNNFMPEGLIVGYWLTGDTRFRDMLLQHAALADNLWIDAWPQYGEGRIQGRATRAILYAGMLNGGVGPAGIPYLSRADQYVQSWITRQNADGSWTYRLETENPASALGQSNFMECERAFAMMVYHRQRAGNGGSVTKAAIEATLKKQVDFLWNTQWLGTGGQAPVGGEVAGTFRYHYSQPDDNTYFDNTDINGFFPPVFAWVAWTSRDATYRDRADQIFASRYGNKFLQGAKQFNQNYYFMNSYLWYRGQI